MNNITLFVRYNQASNEKMNGIIKTLNAEDWDKNLGGHFKSVRELCSHLYIADFNWLKRFSKLRKFETFGDPLFNRELFSFSEILFGDMNEYLTKRTALDKIMILFAAELSEADLSSSLKYTDSSGKEYERVMNSLLLHWLNHETHHRGMISVYLELLGKENDFNSLAAVL